MARLEVPDTNPTQAPALLVATRERRWHGGAIRPWALLGSRLRSDLVGKRLGRIHGHVKMS